MKMHALAGVLAVTALGLVACDTEDKRRDESSTPTGEAIPADGGAPAGQATQSRIVPKGSRVIVEEKAAYRLDPDGTRVRLEVPRIVVEDGIAFRIARDGTKIPLASDGTDVAPADADADPGASGKGDEDVDLRNRDPKRGAR